jgi:hypothetical protein
MVTSNIYTTDIISFIGNPVKIVFKSDHSPDLYCIVNSIESRTLKVKTIIGEPVRKEVKLKEVESIELFWLKTTLDL